MIVLFPFCVITYEDDRRVCVLYDRVFIIQINFEYRSQRYWIQLHRFQLTECHHHHFQRRQFWLNFANHIRSSLDFWSFHSVRATLNSTGSSSKHFSYPLQIFVPSTQSNQSKYLTLSYTCLFMNFMLMSVSFSFHSCQLRFFLMSTRSLSRCILESFSFSFLSFFYWVTFERSRYLDWRKNSSIVNATIFLKVECRKSFNLPTLVYSPSLSSGATFWIPWII